MPNSGMTMERFSSTQVCEMVGISFRQLDYWARTGLVVPSLTYHHDPAAPGSGNRRFYSKHDITILRIIKKALDSGMSFPRVREAISSLSGWRLFEDNWMIICGGNLYVCRNFSEIEQKVGDEPCWVFRFSVQDEE